jgi:ribonuclease J
MWPGYLDRSQSMGRLKKYFENAGVRFKIIHTSGHAKLSDLKKLVENLKPEMIIPIHSFEVDKFQKYFPEYGGRVMRPDFGYSI